MGQVSIPDEIAGSIAGVGMELAILQARDRKWKAFLIVLIPEILITIGLAGKYVFTKAPPDGLIGAVISAFSACNATLTIYMTHNVIQKKIVPSPGG
jgi:hypothetical protein